MELFNQWIIRIDFIQNFNQTLSNDIEEQLFNNMDMISTHLSKNSVIITNQGNQYIQWCNQSDNLVLLL